MTPPNSEREKKMEGLGLHKLDTRLRAGEVITDRERFLLGIIAHLYDMDPWCLDECQEELDILALDFAWTPND
jgi:hypothetical protein